MTDLQTPLRACQSGEVFALFDAEGNYLASIETADVAAEIVRRCNEFEELREDRDRLNEACDLLEHCDHPWHSNPGLINSCPECGAE